MQDTNQSTASAAGTTTDLPPARRPQSLSPFFGFLGIMGPAVTNTVFAPIGLALTTENLEAFKNGLPLPNIFTNGFSNFFTNFGGGGSTSGCHYHQGY